MLFLAGEGHGNCEKVRWTRRHPPMGRRGVTEYPKRNSGSEKSKPPLWICYDGVEMYLPVSGFFSFLPLGRLIKYKNSIAPYLCMRKSYLPNFMSCSLLSVTNFFFRGSPSARYTIKLFRLNIELQTV